MYSAGPLACTIDALGHDRVMFACDYPFESAEEAAHFIETTPLADDVRNAICFANAARMFGFPKSQ
jgi:2,3-dihydroxybenzoate decarboxylase